MLASSSVQPAGSSKDSCTVAFASASALTGVHVARETEPEWDKEIGEDVKGECSKFGTVTHHYVDRNSQVRLSRLCLIRIPQWPLVNLLLARDPHVCFVSLG